MEPEVLLGLGRCKSSTGRVCILYVMRDSATSTGFRLIKPEETIAKERHQGIRDILW